MCSLCLFTNYRKTFNTYKKNTLILIPVQCSLGQRSRGSRRSRSPCCGVGRPPVTPCGHPIGPPCYPPTPPARPTRSPCKPYYKHLAVALTVCCDGKKHAMFLKGKLRRKNHLLVVWNSYITHKPLMLMCWSIYLKS